MHLILDIALTHVRSRLRQTLVGLLGVAMGVGFSVMMAALMEGSQRDFVTQLVDALPHITMTDEHRNPPRQPAEDLYQVVAFSGLSTKATRPGIKNPYAIIASLDGWLDGAVAPSVQARAVIRYAGRDTAANVTASIPSGKPSFPSCPSKCVRGRCKTSTGPPTPSFWATGSPKRSAPASATPSPSCPAQAASSPAPSSRSFHSGVSQNDETQAFTLIKTAQILAGQTGIVNAMRIRVADIMSAMATAERIEARTGYKSVSWQEANEDLLSALEIRNFIMYTVVGAILLVASFGTYNIISTITHEKTRDIAILKSLGFTERTVRSIFLLEALIIGLAGTLVGWVLGYGLCQALETIEFKSPFMDVTHLPIYYAPVHYFLAGLVAMLASGIAAIPRISPQGASVHPVEIIRGAS